MYIPSTSRLTRSPARVLSRFLPWPMPTCANGSSSSSDQTAPREGIVNGDLTVLAEERSERALTRSVLGMDDMGSGSRTSDAAEVDWRASWRVCKRQSNTEPSNMKDWRLRKRRRKRTIVKRAAAAPVT